MDQSSRLRIATRIHFALLRHYDENVPVETLLAGGAQAQEALWVCEASADPELMALAERFAQAEPPPAPRPRPDFVDSRPAPQDADWARNTSGFGVSMPVELDEAAPPKPGAGRRSALDWLRRRSARPTR